MTVIVEPLEQFKPAHSGQIACPVSTPSTMTFAVAGVSIWVRAFEMRHISDCIQLASVFGRGTVKQMGL